ncbi:MAG: FAD-dependent oxidoreductase [Solirubrobacterales bacterium]|nr:FAD-dependent oxidoreductase [Solirubrobacterales bacterium]
MARTPLVQQLQRAAAEAAATQATTTRRTFLAGAGAAAALAAWPVRPAFSASAQPRIVVVGAGLAGLTAAYRLQNAGYAPVVHEASSRAGGRCWSIRGAFADSRQVAEHGGELIDTGHTQMRQLVQELGLDTDNLLQAEQNGTEALYRFDGEPYTYAQATEDLKQIWQQIHKDVSAASYPTLYNLSTERGRELDAMSVAEWIDAYVPGGHGSKLGQLLDVAYNIEYGAECTEQSSLNMLYLIGYSGQGNLRLFGPSNEKFHVRGGNDQVAARLAAKVPVTYGSELVAITDNKDGTHALAFRQGTTTRTVVADRVVLTVPFSILRSSVDLSRSGFSKLKLRAIRELGMGTNSKLNVGFSTRHWRALGNNGDTYADTGYQATWEVSRAQPGTSGILVDYTGGRIGAALTGDPVALARTFVKQLDPVLPGIKDRFDGHAVLDHWPSYRWTKGSYSYWKVGQYTAFAGAEREASGTCHFAGEHTSVDFQGYLNGAVESGERAASEVLAALKK